MYKIQFRSSFEYVNLEYLQFHFILITTEDEVCTL